MTPEPCRGDRGQWHVVIGPPGTGKTSRLQGYVSEVLASGVAACRIGFLTFTHAAYEEARQRVREATGLSGADLVHFRTIHSTAYRLLGLKPEQVLSPKAWSEFGARYGYTLSQVGSGEDEPSELPRRTTDDLMRFAYSWGANRRLDVAGTLRLCTATVSPNHFSLFTQRLDRFKAECGLLDFSDMLVAVLDRRLRPNVDVLFVDEAQDLSPLQIAVVERWAEGCGAVYVAGDDDQAIYAFQGADPLWLQSLGGRWPVEVLQQSHRVPRDVFVMAQRIIGRNRTRIEKHYRPANQDGLVEWVEPDDLVRILDPAVDTLLLARNRQFLSPIARLLFEQQLPYAIEGWGGVSPLSSPGVVVGVRTAVALSCNQSVDADDLSILLKLIPSRGSEFLPYGVKQRVKELAGPLPLDFIRKDLGLGKLIDRITQSSPIEPLVRIPASERAYLAGVLKRFGSLPDRKIRLTTIHGAKGREADTVVVIPDMSRSTYREYMDHPRGGFEAENRVAYVAVTRAMRRLVLVAPRTRRYYDYPAADALRSAA